MSVETKRNIPISGSLLHLFSFAAIHHTPTNTIEKSNIPLLMLRILTTNDIHILTLLPPHALAPITQLLDRAAHLHAADLLAEARCRDRIIACS